MQYVPQTKDESNPKKRLAGTDTTQYGAINSDRNIQEQPSNMPFTWNNIKAAGTAIWNGPEYRWTRVGFMALMMATLFPMEQFYAFFTWLLWEQMLEIYNNGTNTTHHPSSYYTHNDFTSYQNYNDIYNSTDIMRTLYIAGGFLVIMSHITDLLAVDPAQEAYDLSKINKPQIDVLSKKPKDHQLSNFEGKTIVYRVTSQNAPTDLSDGKDLEIDRPSQVWEFRNIGKGGKVESTNQITPQNQPLAFHFLQAVKENEIFIENKDKKSKHIGYRQFKLDEKEIAQLDEKIQEIINANKTTSWRDPIIDGLLAKVTWGMSYASWIALGLTDGVSILTLFLGAIYIFDRDHVGTAVGVLLATVITDILGVYYYAAAYGNAPAELNHTLYNKLFDAIKAILCSPVTVPMAVYEHIVSSIANFKQKSLGEALILLLPWQMIEDVSIFTEVVFQVSSTMLTRGIAGSFIPDAFLQAFNLPANLLGGAHKWIAGSGFVNTAYATLFNRVNKVLNKWYNPRFAETDSKILANSEIYWRVAKDPSFWARFIGGNLRTTALLFELFRYKPEYFSWNIAIGSFLTLQNYFANFKLAQKNNALEAKSILMLTNKPSIETFKSLPLLTNSGYVYFDDNESTPSLYYVDKINNRFINVTGDNLAFIYNIMGLDTSKILSKAELSSLNKYAEDCIYNRNPAALTNMQETLLEWTPWFFSICAQLLRVATLLPMFALVNTVFKLQFDLFDLVMFNYGVGYSVGLNDLEFYYANLKATLQHLVEKYNAEYEAAGMGMFSYYVSSILEGFGGLIEKLKCCCPESSYQNLTEESSEGQVTLNIPKTQAKALAQFGFLGCCCRTRQDYYDGKDTVFGKQFKDNEDLIEYEEGNVRTAREYQRNL